MGLGVLPCLTVGVLPLEGVDRLLVDIGGVALQPLLGHLDEVVHLEALELAVEVEALDGTARETAIFHPRESPGSSESATFGKKRGKGTKEMTAHPGLRKKDVLEISGMTGLGSAIDPATTNVHPGMPVGLPLPVVEEVDRPQDGDPIRVPFLLHALDQGLLRPLVNAPVLETNCQTTIGLYNTC